MPDTNMGNSILFYVISSACLSTVFCSAFQLRNSYISAIVVFNATDSKTGESDRLGSADQHDEIGRYGATSPKDNISGLVQLAATIDSHKYGCLKPYENAQTDVPWIALVERGECNFANKIQEAINVNASGIIIYDTTNQVTITMSHDGADNIVSVIIPRYVGKDVAKRVDAGDRVIASLTQGRQYSDGYSNKTSIIFVSLSFLILMIISLTWLIVYYVQRFRFVRMPDLLQQHRAQARRIVNNLPKKILKEGDKEIMNEEICPVCLETYKTEDTLRILPCQHIFHRKCVDLWLKSKETCPMCKLDVLKSRGLMPCDPVQHFGSRTPAVEVWQPGTRSSDVVTSSYSLVTSNRESTLLVTVEPDSSVEEEEPSDCHDNEKTSSDTPGQTVLNGEGPQTSSQI